MNLHLHVNTEVEWRATNYKFEGALGQNRLTTQLKYIKNTRAFRTRMKEYFLTED